MCCVVILSLVYQHLGTLLTGLLFVNSIICIYMCNFFLHSSQKVFASLVLFADDTLCFLNNIDRFQTSRQPAGTLLSSTDPPTLTPDPHSP